MSMTSLYKFAFFAAITLGLWTNADALERKDLQTSTTTPAAGLELLSQTYQTTSGPVAAYALKVDLSPKFGWKIQPQLGKGKLFSGETPDAMFKRLKANGKDVQAVINGDFWESNTRLYHSVGMFVGDKTFFNMPNKRSVLMENGKSQWHIDRPEIKVQVKFNGNSKTLDIRDINPPSTGTATALYTWDDTKAPAKGYAYRIIKLHTPEFLPNKPVNGTVTGELLTGGTPAPKGELYLAAYSPEAKAEIEKIPSGTEVTVNAACTNITGTIEQAIGGGPRLIRDGKVTVENTTEGIGKDFCTTRHPRTAIGFDKDLKSMVLVVVDGRQPGYSTGISLYDLADLMKEFGCYNAMNLDGGGSSGMYVLDKYINKPSDAKGPRPVVNCLAVIREQKSNIMNAYK